MSKCPKCNNELVKRINGRDLIIQCINCNFNIVSTNSNNYDFDDTKYTIAISANNDISIENIKFVSKLTGENYINSKEYLLKGKIILVGYAIEILPIRKQFMDNNIKYNITPKFNY